MSKIKRIREDFCNRAHFSILRQAEWPWPQSILHCKGNLLKAAQKLLHQHRRLLSWAELFPEAGSDEKKLVAADLIRAVRLTRNYGIEVDFNISEAQYLNRLEMK